MIKLVVFDLWRTLAYKDVANDAYTAIARDVLPHSRIGEFKKTFEQVIQTRRWISKAEAYKALLCRLGVESSQASVAMLATAMDSIEAKARLFPHTMPLLCELVGEGYRTALLSNSSEFAVAQVRNRTELFEHIDYPLFSYDVGALKPDLSVFQEMLDSTRSEPGQTIMVGNSVFHDVLPALQLGMHAFHFTTYERLRKDFAGLGLVISGLQVQANLI